MDMGLRGWMIVIGVLLVLAVLLDGYRRVRNERRGAVRLSLKMGGGFDKDDHEHVNNELPNGGARVLSRTQKTQSKDLENELPSMTATAAEVEPEPMTATEVDFLEEPSVNSTERAAAAESTDQFEAPSEELIVINVIAREGADFVGEDLLQILLACDLRFGKMNIFHRYEKENGKGPVQFSVANIVEPGVFDLDNIKCFNTSGVIFFLGLPGPEDPAMAFEYMLETAQCVVKNLNGELKDENHSVMTAQTLEHYHQRIKDFEQRKITQPA